MYKRSTTRYISCFKALSLRQNRLCPNRKPPSLFMLPASSQRDNHTYCCLKSQYSLLYNVAISSNRFVYNEKEISYKKCRTICIYSIIFYCFFFFPYKRTSANPVVCSLLNGCSPLLRSFFFPLWQWTFCVYKQIQIRHWQGSKKEDLIIP